MNSQPKTITKKYLIYKDVYGTIIDFGQAENMLNLKLNMFSTLDGISFTSLLNMCFQTQDIKFQFTKEGSISKKPETLKFDRKNQILYFRDNLIVLITKFIYLNPKGKYKITGHKSFNNSIRSYRDCFLLINTELNELTKTNPFYTLRALIKDNPLHDSVAVHSFYFYRLIRYRKIYCEIYPYLDSSIDGKFVPKLQLFMNEFEVQVNVNIKDYIEALISLFGWFMAMNVTKEKGPKFQPNEISSFYIDLKRFSRNKDFQKTIKSLSISLSDMNLELHNSKQKKTVDNEIYKFFREMFDNPILRINNDEYIITDFKNIIEGICGALYWRIQKFNESTTLQESKGYYGNLIEKYFKWLMLNVFGVNFIDPPENGNPDGMVEVSEGSEKYVFIFEFTTKFYEQNSLLNIDNKAFFNDFENKFFNIKYDGKFVKLNTYIENYITNVSNVHIIPILVTENWVGDFDMINYHENTIDNLINKYKLDELKKHKPLILSLDDLEAFWLCSPLNKEALFLLKVYREWDKADKGLYFYNIRIFILTKYSNNQINSNYQTEIGSKNPYQ